MNVPEWKEQLLQERAEKDEFFRMHPQSPVPQNLRRVFKGLHYYPPDPKYRFELQFFEHDQKKTLIIEDTKGNERKFLRWGEFRFKINNQDCVLQGYKSSPQEKRLFIPFRDETSGKETYGAGRYLDLEEEWHRDDKGKWVLDFNHAYNPWCAYSEQYACPFVDPENWLKAAIRAGEKIYP